MPNGPRARTSRAVWVAVAFAMVVFVAVGVGSIALVGGAVRSGARRSVASGNSTGASGPAAVVSGPEQRVSGIRKALIAMTDGLRTRDEALFLSAVDVRQAGVLARVKARFAALEVAPLEEPQFSWSGDFPQPEPYDPAEPVTIVTEFSYRLHDWDAITAHDPVTLRFGPSGDRWVVTDDTVSAGGDLPIGPYAEPWSTGVLAIVRRPHVMVLGDANRRPQLRRLADDLERVVGDVRRGWPEPSWNGKVVAYAATDRRFVNEWFGDHAADDTPDKPDGQASFEARVASLPGQLRDGQWERGPTRLLVTPYLLAQSGEYSRSVLRHEVTHVATDHLGRYPPAWLLEGAAEYTGFRLGGARVDASRTFGEHGVPPTTGQAMRRGTWRPVLVIDPDAFYRGASRTVEAAYTDGWVAALYVADRYGDATLRRLYEVACAQPDDASDEQVEAFALRTVLKTDHAGLTAAVRAYGIKLRRSFP